jgi:hypothetical protein
MSASREKKQRQGSGPSDRELHTQQQTAEYKRKARTYTIIGVVVVILVAALLIWNSGIFQRNQTAATVGSTNYTVNDLNYYYQSARYSENYIYYAYGMTSYIPDDDDVRDEESGQTYREYYLEVALDDLTNATALYDAAIANGYSDQDVADDVKDTIASTKSAASSNGYSYSAYLKAMYGRYMTASAYKSIITKVAVINAYYSDYSDSLTYTDEELETYYSDNRDDLDTYEYSYLYFAAEDIVTTDDDGNDLELTDEETAALEEEALADAEDKANHALDQINDGSSIADVADEYELSSTSYGDHVTTVGSSVSSVYSDELFSYADGESGIMEYGDSGYYVLVLHERTLIEEATADVRHILISAETTTDDDGNTVAPTDEAWAEAKATAEDILAQYQSGEQTEDAFAALANEYSTDSGSNTNGGLYEGNSNGAFVTEFNDWVFDSSRQPGDVGMVQHIGSADDSNPYYGYHIIYYVGENDPVWKQTAASALRSDDLSAWQEDLASNYTSSLTSAAEYVAQ